MDLILKTAEFEPLRFQAHQILQKHSDDFNYALKTFRKKIKRIRNRILDGKILREHEVMFAENDYFGDLMQETTGTQAWNLFKQMKNIEQIDNATAIEEFYKEYVNIMQRTN